MTGDRPSGEDLLGTAACALREDVLQTVPPEHRLALLMALNAMGIAERELRDLRGRAADAGERPDAATRTLAGKIRAGHFDEGPGAEALHARLSADVRRRLAIANPKYLRQAEEKD